MYQITLIPGDGTGPEVTAATTAVLTAAGAPIEWEVVLVGENAFREYGTLLPEETLASIYRNKIALRTPDHSGGVPAFAASMSPCAKSLTSSLTCAPPKLTLGSSPATKM